MAQAQAKLAFGIEIELLLKPKKQLLAQLDQIYESQDLGKLAPGSKDWATGLEVVKKAQAVSEDPAQNKTDAQKQAAKATAEKFRAAFRSRVATALSARDFPAALKSSDFTEWSVVDEPTLDEVPGYCRVEFVSRTIASNDAWQLEFDELYKFLNSRCDVARTTGCSTHVHVSPSAKPKGREDKWSHLDLRSIMKALSYYDQPITKVMPAERKQNPYAMSNMTLANLSKYYAAVEMSSWKPLFDFYDMQLKSAILARNAHAIMGGDRLASWNFEHITDQCGTIEFRRSPGCDNVAKAKHWVNFTLGFVYHAAKGGFDWSEHQNEKKHPSVADLSAFVTKGVNLLEPGCNALEPIAEDKSPASVFNAAETARKKAKMATRASPYAESVARTPPGTPVARSPASSPASSRPNTPPSRAGTPTGRAPAPSTGNTPNNSRPATPTGRAPATSTGNTPNNSRPATPTGHAPATGTSTTLPTRTAASSTSGAPRSSSPATNPGRTKS